jgi:hypothetical protein
MTNKYKLVPIEPTDEMMSAGCGIDCKEPCYADCKNNGILRAQYKAMLEAAPPADVEPVAWLIDDEMHLNGFTLEKRTADYYSLLGKATPLYTQPPADKDAERYRWLCMQQDTSTAFIMGKYASKEGSYGDFSCEKINIDEAIDKAMGEHNGKS